MYEGMKDGFAETWFWNNSKICKNACKDTMKGFNKHEKKKKKEKKKKEKKKIKRDSKGKEGRKCLSPKGLKKRIMMRKSW